MSTFKPEPTEKEPESAFAAMRREWEKMGLIDPNAPAGPTGPPASVADMIRQQRVERFKSFCPARFAEKIDRALIPNLPAWDEADSWDGKHIGLWLWSHDTGEAKSRMLWRKFGQIHVDQGRSVVRITGANLAEEYHDAFNHSKTNQFYRVLDCADVVMLDDLDKIPLPRAGQGFGEQLHADRNARMIREIFDRFYEQKKAVLVTSNENVDWFAQRIGPSGERRIRETCREIAF